MIDLDAIKAKLAATTPGPWEWGTTPWGSPVLRRRLGEQGLNVINADPSGGEYELAIDPGGSDAAFIAHARTDVPALVAEVERLRAALLDLAAIHGPGEVGEELEAMGEGLA